MSRMGPPTSTTAVTDREGHSGVNYGVSLSDGWFGLTAAYDDWLERLSAGAFELLRQYPPRCCSTSRHRSRQPSAVALEEMAEVLLPPRLFERLVSANLCGIDD